MFDDPRVNIVLPRAVYGALTPFGDREVADALLLADLGDEAAGALVGPLARLLEEQCRAVSAVVLTGTRTLGGAPAILRTRQALSYLRGTRTRVTLNSGTGAWVTSRHRSDGAAAFSLECERRLLASSVEVAECV